MRAIGGIVFCAGVFLFFGNIVGFFRTFPGLGYITMAIGGFIYKKAG